MIDCVTLAENLIMAFLGGEYSASDATPMSRVGSGVEVELTRQQPHHRPTATVRELLKTRNEH